MSPKDIKQIIAQTLKGSGICIREDAIYVNGTSVSITTYGRDITFDLL